MSMERSEIDVGYLEPGGKNVILVYILYLVGFVIGLTTLVGLVFAYLNRGKTGGWVESHYTFQIRTFWIGLLYGLVAFALMFVGIGFLLMIAVAVWAIIRCVKGLQASGRKEPIANPETWLF
ncbi:hypothetical protein H2509_19080 [Stappia sp. F7233]|uniref:DUF4870 domain-containing protein n=1 Tax=Stappia albiluteola TaxID=2758565 RepID=A0A839AJN2_9HYPH|nr:hypothetical protein [Stappia albiluteola]MBA5779238.1 hypothetical protein [Stappia albiluteola]